MYFVNRKEESGRRLCLVYTCGANVPAGIIINRLEVGSLTVIVALQDNIKTA